MAETGDAERPFSYARPLGLASVAVTALAAVAWFALRQPAPVTAPTPVATPPAAASPPQVAPAAPEPPRPSFDIVRVAPTGEAVLAGRGAPGQQVTVSDGSHELGHTTADANGTWVLTPATPLPPGTRELTLSGRGADGRTVTAEAPVVVLVPTPAPPTIAAAEPAVPHPAPFAAPPAAPPAAPATPPPPNPAAAQSPPQQRTAIAVLTPPNAAPELLQAPPLKGPAPSLDVLDYDAAGNIRFAGRAAPGSTLRLYVDNVPVGEADANAKGLWSLQPTTAMAPGDHRLRLDRVGPDGKVVARIDLPFQRAAPEQSDGQVVVQPRQTLWAIARHSYGQGVRYTLIYDANRQRIANPDLIYPGQVFTLPAGRTDVTPTSSSRSR